MYWHSFVKVSLTPMLFVPLTLVDCRLTGYDIALQGKWFGTRGPFRPIDYLFAPGA